MERPEWTAGIVVDNREIDKIREEIYRDAPLPFSGSISVQFPRTKTAGGCDTEIKQGTAAEGNSLVEESPFAERRPSAEESSLVSTSGYSVDFQ